MLVSSSEEMRNLSIALQDLDCNDGNRYTTILTTGTNQIFLLGNGKPISSYRLVGSGITCCLEVGMSVINSFIDSLNEFKHLAMLYDDPKLARQIEFRFIKQGLERGERCIYAMPEDDLDSPDSIIGQMETFGINTDCNDEDGWLKFTRISDPSRNPEGFKVECRKMISSFLKENKTPRRLVLHTICQFKSDKHIESHPVLENAIEANFSDFQGAMLCIHYMDKDTREKHREWTRKMLLKFDNLFLVSSRPDLQIF